MPETGTTTGGGGETSAAGERGREGARAWRLAAVGLSVAWGGFLATLFCMGLADLLLPTGRALVTILGIGTLLAGYLLLGWRLRRLFFPRLGAELSTVESLLLELSLGLGATIALIFALGCGSLLVPAAAYGVAALPWIGPLRPFFRQWRDRWAGAAGSRKGISPRIASLLAVAALVTLAEALAPPTSQDALVYHLAVPARFIREGKIGYVEGNFFSAFPMNVEMLYTFGLLLGDVALAKWHHWLFGLASSAAVLALARRLLADRDFPGTRWGFLASALYATIPTAALIAGWAYVDLAVVFFTLLSVLFWLCFREAEGEEREVLPPRAGAHSHSHSMLVISALAAGLAAGTKYTGGFQAVLLVLALLASAARHRWRWPLLARRIGLVALAAGAVAAPWYLKNLVTTGNPVFPFAWSWFGGADWDGQRAGVLALSLREWGGGRTGSGLLSLPWDVSLSGRFFSPEHFDGVIGFGFLLGAPLLLVGLRRGGPMLRSVFLFAAAHAGFWVATTHQIRFLLPALALGAALVVSSLARIASRGLRIVHEGFLELAVAANVVLILIHFAAHQPLSVVLGLESEDAYLAREIPGSDYEVFRAIDDELPDDAKILFGSCGNPGYLCHRSYHSDALFENFTLLAHLRQARGPDDLGRRLRAEGFTHLLFRFDCVFDPSGRKSEIPVGLQQLFAQFLNQGAREVARAGLTFLYELKDPPEAEAPATRAVLP